MQVSNKRKYEINPNDTMHPINGLVKTFNKTFYIIFKKLVDKNKMTWLNKFPEAMLAYRNIFKTDLGNSMFLAQKRSCYLCFSIVLP